MEEYCEHRLVNQVKLNRNISSCPENERASAHRVLKFLGRMTWLMLYGHALEQDPKFYSVIQIDSPVLGSSMRDFQFLV